jgi:undecaprenyl-diphosphatase
MTSTVGIQEDGQDVRSAEQPGASTPVAASAGTAATDWPSAPPPAGATARRVGGALDGMRPLSAVMVVSAVGYAVVAFIAILAGSLIARFVVGGRVGAWDHDVARWFADRRTPTWNDASLVGSHLGGTATVIGLVAVVVGLLAWRRMWWLATFVIVSISLEGLVYLTATFVVVRDRPAVPRLEALIVSDSFPSGHTAAAVTVYGAIAIVVWSVSRSRHWRVVTVVAAVVIPLLVATSRVYRGMHNPTDVLCGACIGVLCLVVGRLAAGTGAVVAARRRTEREAERDRTTRGETHDGDRDGTRDATAAPADVGAPVGTR